MNLSESMRTLRKRWVLTSSLLVLVLVVTVVAAGKLHKTYQSTADVAFLASQSSSKVHQNNPYLAFDSSLNIAADAVGRRMMDPRVVSSLAARGYTSPYKVADAANSPGPVLIITVTGSKPSAIEHTLQGVTNEIAVQLTAMQSGVAPQNRIRQILLSFSLKPSLVLSKTLRPFAAVVVVGLVLVIGTPLIVEGISVRRRTRKRRADASDAESAEDIPRYTDSADDIPRSTRPSPISHRHGAVPAGFRDRTGKSL